MTDQDLRTTASTDEEIRALTLELDPLTPIEVGLEPIYGDDEPAVDPLTGTATKVSANRLERKDSIAIEGILDEPVDGHRYFEFSIWYHVPDDTIDGVRTVSTFDYADEAAGGGRIRCPVGTFETISAAGALSREEVYGE